MSSSMPFCPAPPAAWKLVATIALRPNASCSALAGSMTTIVVQFGLATMLRGALAISSGLTSLTTSGTSASIRNALELSTTSAPASANRAAHSRDRVAPALNSARSKPLTDSSLSSWQTSPSSSSRPTLRSLANATSSASPNRSWARRRRMVPTAPVAPMMATRMQRRLAPAVAEQVALRGGMREERGARGGVVADPRVGPVAVPERLAEERGVLPVHADQGPEADVVVLDEPEGLVEPGDRVRAVVGAHVRRRRLGDDDRQRVGRVQRLRLIEDLARALLVEGAALGARAAEAARVLPVGDAKRVDVLAAWVERADRLGVVGRHGHPAVALELAEERLVGPAPERTGRMPHVDRVSHAVGPQHVDDVAVGELVDLGRSV